MIKYPITKEEAEKRNSNLWPTQPVAQINEVIGLDEGIDKLKTNNKEYRLLDSCRWVEYNINNHDDAKKISNFINKYYMKEQQFRSYYSDDFLKWYFGFGKSILLGVEYCSKESDDSGTCKNKLIGFISGVVTKNKINKHSLDLVEVKFLTVASTQRNKRLAPVLMKELRRRFNLLGYIYGTFATQTYLFTPFFTGQSRHRPININILLEAGLFSLKEGVRRTEMIKACELPRETGNTNFVKANSDDAETLYNLFNKFIGKYNIYPEYDLETFKHIFFNQNIMVVYVLKDDNDNIIDFISYYKLPYKVGEQSIRCGYIFYYTCLEETSYRLISDMLIVARNNKMHLMNIMNIMESENILANLGFENASTNTYHYLYNWKTPTLINEQVCRLFI